MKLKYGELETVISFLLDELSLVGKNSRMRMRLLNILNTKNDEFHKYHFELLKEHCDLDEYGNPKTIMKDGQGYWDVVDIQAFSKEYEELMLEEVIIEENEENREMLLTVRDAINNCPTAYSGKKAIVYEMVASIFDHIYEGD